MMSEPFDFFINNDQDGDLTAAGDGWRLADSVPPTGAAGGGVTMQWVAGSAEPPRDLSHDPPSRAGSASVHSALPDAPTETGTGSIPGWYYSITGGSTVGIARSRDLVIWEPYRIVMSQAVGQYQRAPLNGFPGSAARKGWAEMAEPAHWPSWGFDNNDGDVCCGDQAAAARAGHGTSPSGWVIWGASTQGGACGLAHCSSNAVGSFNGTLGAMLGSFFQ